MFPDGKSEDLGKPEGKRVLTDGEAYEVTKILKRTSGGTGTAANYGCPAAGKTGTTDDFNDAWFVGYTPQARRRPSGSAIRTPASRCRARRAAPTPRRSGTPS